MTQVQRLYSQSNSIVLTLKQKASLIKFGNVPFKKMSIIDSRLDSGQVYIFETNYLPIKSFTVPLGSKNLETYFQEIINGKKKGDNNLLLVLERLKISNKKYVLRRSPTDNKVRKIVVRLLIEIKAKAFVETNKDHYREIVTLEYISTYYDKKSVVESNVSDLLTLLFIASCDIYHFTDSSLSKRNRKYRYLDNSLIYKYSNDTASLSLGQIHHQTISRWKYLPIMQSSHQISGVFKCFDDFKHDSLTSADIDMKYEEKNGYYTAIISNGGLGIVDSCWAIADRGSIYYHLLKNVYIKMRVENGKINLDLPPSLPNIYTLLSIEDQYWNFDTHKMLSEINLEQINSLIAKFPENAKKLALNEDENPIMHCWLDLDSGDISY